MMESQSCGELNTAFAGYDGHREARTTPDWVRQQRKTPAASRDRGFSKANAKFRSISADVDGAQAVAERGEDGAGHIASGVTIAATDVAGARAGAEEVMMKATKAPPHSPPPPGPRRR